MDRIWRQWKTLVRGPPCRPTQGAVRKRENVIPLPVAMRGGNGKNGTDDASPLLPAPRKRKRTIPLLRTDKCHDEHAPGEDIGIRNTSVTDTRARLGDKVPV